MKVLFTAQSKTEMRQCAVSLEAVENKLVGCIPTEEVMCMRHMVHEGKDWEYSYGNVSLSVTPQFLELGD